MPPQLREQVERVFQAGDPVVRSEVESLLAFASASGVADQTVDSATAPYRTPAAAVGRRDRQLGAGAAARGRP